MAKTYVPCATAAECMAAHSAGLLYWFGVFSNTWHKYEPGANISEGYFSTILAKGYRKTLRPSVLVDTDEE